MSAPVAVASIELSEEQRKRIAAELGLGADELDAVPTKLDIAKYEAPDDSDDEVGGFAFNPGSMNFSPVASPLKDVMVSSVAKIGRSPGFILVTV